MQKLEEPGLKPHPENLQISLKGQNWDQISLKKEELHTTGMTNGMNVWTPSEYPSNGVELIKTPAESAALATFLQGSSWLTIVEGLSFEMSSEALVPSTWDSPRFPLTETELAVDCSESAGSGTDFTSGVSRRLGCPKNHLVLWLIPVCGFFLKGITITLCMMTGCMVPQIALVAVRIPAPSSNPFLSDPCCRSRW